MKASSENTQNMGDEHQYSRECLKIFKNIFGNS